MLDGLKENRNDERLHYGLVELLLDLKKFQDADTVLKSMPDRLKQGVAWLELAGSCKIGLKALDEAEGYADQMLALDATSAKASNLKGLVAFERGNHSEAERFFEKAIESDAGFGGAYANLGGLKWSLKDYESAFELIERAFILSPADESIALNFHSAAVAFSRLERASMLFREAASRHPLNKRLKYMLADLLLQQEQFHEAMDVIEEALLTFDMDNDSLALAGALREKIGPHEKDPRIQGAKGSSETQSEERFRPSRNDRKEDLDPGILESSNPTLSVCMIVKDEEKNIGRCLHKIKPLADEIVVVDTGSTDRTKEIAKVFGAKVYDFAWTDSFSDARNFALSKSTSAWNLVLDADEAIAPSDFKKLKKMISKGPRGQGFKDSKEKGSRIQGAKDSSEKDSFKHSDPGILESLDPASFVPRTLDPLNPASIAFSFVTRNYIMPMNTPGWVANDGTYLSEEAGTGWFSSSKVRLFPNDTRIRFDAPVHEFVERSLAAAGIAVRECPVPVHHYGKLDAEKLTPKAHQYYELGKAKLLERGEEDALSLFEIAVQASELHEFEDALVWWKKIVALRPDFSRAYYGLGNAYFRLGRFEEAASAIRMAIETARKDTEWRDAVILFSHTAVFIGKAGESMPYIDQLLKKHPDDPLASMLLASAHFFTGSEEKGLELLHRLRKRNYDASEFLAQFAEHLADNGKPSPALVLLNAAVKTNMVRSDVPALIAECERKLKEKDSRGQGSKGSSEINKAQDSASKPSPDSSFILHPSSLPVAPRTLEPLNPVSSAPGTLSLCMIVKNEENNIRRALKSAKPVVDEMIVVDTGSTDKTKEIAQEMGAKVYDFAWTNSFADARNFAL